jgi:hypothetical protein
MTHKLQEKPSALKREHPALENMKIIHFFKYSICGSFLPSWIQIQQLKLMRIRIHNPFKFYQKSCGVVPVEHYAVLCARGPGGHELPAGQCAGALQRQSAGRRAQAPVSGG